VHEEFGDFKTERLVASAALKSPIVCIYLLFFVDILHDLMFFVVHAQTFSIRNTDRFVVGVKKAICFPKYIT